MAQKIPLEIQQRIAAQIDSGGFSTVEEVLREAMDALERRQRGLQQLREMVREADDDIAAGRVGPFDAGKTLAEIQQQLSQQTHGD